MYTVAKGSRRFISAEEIEIAQAMRATGTAPSEIASQLNLAATTIYRTLKRSAGDVATKTGGYHGRRGWLGLEQYLDKDLSPLLENMTREQLRVFLHAVNMGDGAKNKQHFKTTMRITSTNHLFASRLQSICVRRGFSAYLSIRKTRTKADKLVYDVYIRDGAEAVIHHRGKKNSFSQCEAIEGERVWCVTNELGTLVTRRNGKVCVLGNCDARIYRDGQPLPVFSYFLLAEEGSDPIISDILGVKRAQLEGVRDMKVGGDLPQEIEVMNPFKDKATMQICTQFYKKYYSDNNKRRMIIGINPGRFGGGITGILGTGQFLVHIAHGALALFPNYL